MPKISGKLQSPWYKRRPPDTDNGKATAPPEKEKAEQARTDRTRSTMSRSSSVMEGGYRLMVYSFVHTLLRIVSGMLKDKTS